MLDEFKVTTTTAAFLRWWFEDEDQDGTNEYHEEWVPETTTTTHHDAGTDALVFGPGIARSDIVVRASGDGKHLIVGVKDPAHPGVPFEQLTDNITLKNWFDPDGKDRIELLRFADGSTLDIAAALGTYLVPFGETLSRSSVAENSAVGTVVGTVAAFDLDANAVLTYSLRDDVTGGRFSIDASTGVIRVAGALNYEATPAWPLTVRVADQNGNFFDKPFVINVTNVNDAPSEITLSGGTVPERSPGGTIIATATGIDQDPGTVFTWSLTDTAGGRFLIYPTGQIAVVDSGLIDYEAASSHQVTVRATDQGGMYLDKVVTLSLTNVNEAPTGITLSGGSAPEHSPGGTIIATASGIDPDAGTVFTWSLTDNAGGRFLIYQTGQIAVVDLGLIDYETASSYQVTVRAADQSGLSFAKSFTLNIANVNEAPTNATLVGGAVLENAATGAYVATIAGIDPDANTVFNYSLVDPDGRFAIDASTGVVTVLYGALLDYETATSQQITVRTADQFGLSFDKSWTVNVYDGPDAPTDARLFGGTVREHSANGTRVGTVIGTDADAASVLSYTLLDDAGGRFDVDASTGVITVQDGTLLDYATAQSHTLMVRTSDQIGLFYDRPLTVAIAAGPVNNANGTSTVTIHDGADAFGWSSFTSTYNGPDGHGSLLSQLGSNDGGSKVAECLRCRPHPELEFHRQHIRFDRPPAHQECDQRRRHPFVAGQ